MKNELINNIGKLHTTTMGVDRIKKNLQIDCKDVVKYCHDVIVNDKANIERIGKNYYIDYENMIITVNAYSYTIITAHKKKK